LEKQKTIIGTDYSDETGFEFGFSCGICGFEWRSERIPYDIDNMFENLDEKDRELLWKEERQKCFDQIKMDAAIEFNKCPECGTWVCDDCFYVDGGDLTDFCVECIEVMK